jgi:cell wall-associated NlpC family hydrolase
MRRAALGAMVAGLAVLAAGWLALGASGNGHPAAQRLTAAATATPAADLPPLPAAHPKVVQPVAGGSAHAPTPTEDPGLKNAGPAPTGPATDAVRGAHPGRGGAGAVSRATALGNGVALPPLEAPDAVRQIIEAGNAIARTPYLWGGGHGRWLDKGYDCSGSVSFVLASAGLLGGPLDSGHLMSWGQPGKGRWVTIYASPTHVFLEVAGIRFDTGAQSVTGSRWASFGRSTAGFAARHPAGL